MHQGKSEQTWWHRTEIINITFKICLPYSNVTAVYLKCIITTIKYFMICILACTAFQKCIVRMQLYLFCFSVSSKRYGVCMYVCMFINELYQIIQSGYQYSV